MFRKPLFLAAFGLLAGALWGGPTALDVKPPRLQVQSSQLDNGLQILLLEDHSTPVINLQVWYHVGSKNEKEGKTGFAHLFEHMMFQGSENVGVDEHKRYIEDIGGRYNAYTAFDQTVYWETFPANYLERMLWLEADRMRSLKITDENFKAEREVVKEERRLRFENPPFGRLLEIVLQASYKTHPYAHPPIGSMTDLNAASLEDVRDFHSLYYVPNNATLVISGDFDRKQALDWVDKYFRDIPRGKPIPRRLPAEMAQEKERRVTEYDSKAPLAAVILAYHVPGDGDPDIYALQVAGNILSAGQSSRLYRRMVYEDQMAVAAAGQTLALEDPGVFAFFAFMNQGKSAEEGEKTLSEEIQKLKEEPVTETELLKAKNQFVSELVFGRESVQEKADAVGRAAVLLGDVALVNQELDRFQKVTAADIQRVAAKYFSDNNRSVVYMLPEAMRPKDGDKGSDGN